MEALRGFFTGIGQGIIANILYAVLISAGPLALWALIRRVREWRRGLPVAVAYPLGVSILYAGNPLDPVNSSIQIHCSVTFYAVKRATESPTVLLITGTEPPYETICQIELGRPPSTVKARSWGPGLTYAGTIKFIERNLLLQAIARTHEGKLPEIGPVFVEVCVALPTGIALAEYSKSKVQFGLLHSDPPKFTIKIANWPNGVPEFWRKPVFMDFVR